MKLRNSLHIRRNSKISKFAKIYAFSKISNSKIDDYTYVSFNCTINCCEIGKYCSIASGVKIGLGKHPTNFISTSPMFYAPKNPLGNSTVDAPAFVEHEKVYLGNDVWIGANVVILDGISIGDGAIVGANSIVTKDIEPYSIVGGVPAKEIKKRFSDEIINKLNLLQWWNLPFAFFKQKHVKEVFSKPLDGGTIDLLLEAVKEYQNRT